MSDNRSEKIKRVVDSLDDAFHAEVDAEISRRLALGEKADRSGLIRTSEDPLGFAWSISGTPYPTNEIQSEQFINKSAVPIPETALVNPPVQSQLPIVTAGQSAETGKRHISRNNLIWTTALAASIVGVFVGRLLWKEGPKPKGQEVLMARANLSDAAPKGVGVIAVNVELSSPRSGFATILVFSDPIQTFPLGDQDPISVQLNTPSRYGPVEASVGTLVLTLITETPSRETIRKGLTSIKYDTNNPVDFRDKMLKHLELHGYQWVAWSESYIPKP